MKHRVCAGESKGVCRKHAAQSVNLHNQVVILKHSQQELALPIVLTGEALFLNILKSNI